MSTDAAGETDTTNREAEDAILSCEGLSVSYGTVAALRDIDLTVGDDEMVGVIGPNGAGKTTLSNTVTGFLDYSGRVGYRGEEVRERSVNDLVASGLIHCTESRDLFGFMTVEDNLQLGAYRHSEVGDDRLEFVYELFPRLEERSDQHARTMSGGEQQMLAIGRSLMGDPDCLVLDEPTLGLAPVVIEDISGGIERIREAGVTVLLCEQNVTFAMDHADHIYLLENGELVREGDPETLRGDEYIRDAYLGG
jgi:branched-chain amino acid transport system ATP-binding protein